ncbi:MurR/RpiR family transcriptional regulator [Aggregatibacter actinomycetemcomitans]|uniref:MurR/RpiR family transcriptional regulator n=1 Tax=Aggregatibacter actinomycetemcomitans TaxID=714 RepID=UPI00022AC609|nr:MurR/RpiR family transcriptional regulator [Aggregatibacter actinomycetemcomitans]AEW77852.1 N-acetylmannosamine kinase [Aggregatibacter actinomycetemcomitans ANH9381]AMQ91937.1 N-acetylmannosamine kinase [Aggregatibacter actinomycetemcomitans]KOE52917.1 N-acetylmannosamine kinase [Aggregatibacter actinomycetemcomitans serotype b str. I23C]KOE57078.1 N-acetylmannosamine kinase [Aggregatibacter actinomycetemcomitans serotype b str. S23A]MBN6059687.1 MurR/RpiR family transcriptional regulator
MATNGNVLNTVSALYQSLTKTEKKIADVISQSPEMVMQYSLSELASNLNVGEATFVRFCRTLGFKGFSDFKLAFSIELATARESRDDTVLETEIMPDDDSLKIAHKLQAAISKVMDETVNLLDFQQLESVVRAIQKAKRVFLFGVGSSGVTAEDAKNKFMRIGVPVDATGNNHFMYMQAALLKETDVAIGISHSGYSQETAHTLKIAKQNGATTVALTHSLRSPITEHADFVLVNGNKQGKLQGDSIGTKIAQLFVLDLIYALLVQAKQDAATKTKQKTLNVILEQRIK